MYDPKDPFSLLNPHSAVNQYLQSQREQGQRMDRMARESAQFVDRFSAGPEVAPEPAAPLYPNLPKAQPLLTRKTETARRPSRKEEKKGGGWLWIVGGGLALLLF